MQVVRGFQKSDFGMNFLLPPHFQPQGVFIHGIISQESIPPAIFMHMKITADQVSKSPASFALALK